MGLVLVLVLVLAWPIGLVIWADGKIQHVDAISGRAWHTGDHVPPCRLGLPR
ncbi:hypothetical protein [Salana multivorans]